MAMCDENNDAAEDGWRADFERVASDNGAWPAAVARNAGGGYKLMSTEAGWSWWRAACLSIMAASKAAKAEAVVFMDADTLAAMQATPISSKTRWPVYRLREWESKAGMAALCLCNETTEAPQTGEWLAAADVHRLTRDIDVALNGEAGSAQQAMLCDIAGLVAGEVRKRGNKLLLEVLWRIDVATRDYHYALDTRKNGNLAAGALADAVQQALGMPWQQGVEKQHRDYRDVRPCMSKYTTLADYDTALAEWAERQQKGQK